MLNRKAIVHWSFNAYYTMYSSYSPIIIGLQVARPTQTLKTNQPVTAVDQSTAGVVTSGRRHETSDQFQPKTTVHALNVATPPKTLNNMADWSASAPQSFTAADVGGS